MKLHFDREKKVELEFSLCGVLGAAVPALVTLSFPNPIVAFIASLVSVAAGFYIAVRMFQLGDITIEPEEEESDDE